jgi:hypothetical protein
MFLLIAAHDQGPEESPNNLIFLAHSKYSSVIEK